LQKVITQYKHNLRYRVKTQNPAFSNEGIISRGLVPLNTKLLAWVIFLIFFIEAGTLGILPKSFYFLYRNVRLSDALLYCVVIYSLFCVGEYRDLFFSKSFIIIKLLFIYLFFQFIISVISYKVEAVEYFFRMKFLWLSLLVFPFMLLLKRNGLIFLVKFIFPFAVVSNILYIISAVTGVAFLPDISIVQQILPGGLKVWRVYGGTFFGEFFFLGIIFYWTEYRFRLIHLPLVVLFGLPHILSFGRGSWIFFIFAISFIIVWGSYRKHNIKSAIKQAVVLGITIFVFIYAFNKFLPEPEELSESIQARIEQGQDDFKYGEGTLATRLANQKALFELWAANPVFGIGMHPFWVIKPVTTLEAIYAWGFSDLKWVSVLVAYGAVGFLIALAFQVYYLFQSFKLLRKVNLMNINYFFLLIFLLMMLRDSVLGYIFSLITVGINGLGIMTALYVANIVYLYEKYSSGDLRKAEKHITENFISAKFPKHKAHLN